MLINTKTLILLLLVSLTANAYLALQLHKNAVLGSNTKASEKVKPSITQPFTCNYDLRLSEAAKKLNNNHAALNIIKQNCLWLFGSLSADLEQKGTDNLIFWASGAGCVSCHAQQLYVLSGNKIVAQKDLDDPIISMAKTDTGENALVISEPLRQHNQSLSSPSWRLVTSYLLGKDNQFYAFDQRPEMNK